MTIQEPTEEMIEAGAKIVGIETKCSEGIDCEICQKVAKTIYLAMQASSPPIPKAHREAVARAIQQFVEKSPPAASAVPASVFIANRSEQLADAAIIAHLHVRADGKPIIDQINAILNADAYGGRVSQDTVDALVELVRNGGGAGWRDMLPDEIDIFRTMRATKSNSRAAQAKAVARLLDTLVEPRPE